MKKLTVFTILFAFLVIISNSAFATTATADLNMSASEVSADNTVVVTLKLANDVTVDQWDFTLEYDSEALEYVSTTSGIRGKSPDGNDDKYVRITGNNLTPQKEFNVTFKVIKEGVAVDSSVLKLIDASYFSIGVGDSKTSYEINKGQLPDAPKPTVTPTPTPSETPVPSETPAVTDPGSQNGESGEQDDVPKTGVSIVPAIAILLTAVLGATIIIKRK